jgi:hypothetical protein
VTRLFLLMLVSASRDERYFDERVAPILMRRCLGCHNAELMNGGVSFTDRASLLRGGPRGPAIVPGKPDESVMIQALRHEGQLQMPPGPVLPGKEVKVLTEWVRRGEVWSLKLFGK